MQRRRGERLASTSAARAVFQEREGVSLILPVELHPNPESAAAMKQITLNVYSALEGVGLSAAVATALADKGIPCNMIAAFHHDHVFVPADRTQEAMSVLLALQCEHSQN